MLMCYMSNKIVLFLLFFETDSYVVTLPDLDLIFTSEGLGLKVCATTPTWQPTLKYDETKG